MMIRTQTPMNKLSRRGFSLGLASISIAALASPAFAISESKARSLVDLLVADLNKIISSGKSERSMIKDFEKLFAKYADIPVMARYALGADARSASSGQLRKFTKAFQGYIARKYGKQFRVFIGGKVVVKSSRKVKSFIEVKSMAHLKGQAPFEVKFLVSDKSGKDKFFNMFIEGINMLLTERTEIGAMLDKRRGNIDKMIADLKKAG